MKIIWTILSRTGELCVQTILFLGYPGILILMAMESMVFPVPSEMVMPLAGYLVSQGKMSFLGVLIFSSLGSLFGSLISYYFGLLGRNNNFFQKWGKYFLLDMEDLEKTEQWFQKRGEKTVLLSRFIPVVRHLISIPAGIGKMKLKKFCFYTIIGATAWNMFLAYIGFLLGKNWEVVSKYSKFFSLPIAAVILVLLGYFVYKRIKKRMKRNEQMKTNQTNPQQKT
ncbi:MAG: DedA family protein [Nanoarchaeota archaeon]